MNSDIAQLPTRAKINQARHVIAGWRNHMPRSKWAEIDDILHLLSSASVEVSEMEVRYIKK